MHYLYGGIRLQSVGDRLSGAAQVQISVLLGIFVLAKALDYWLDRYDLAYQSGGLLTGITATDNDAVLPAKGILMGIAVICAVLFFVNVWRRTWLLPSVGISLLALSAILLGVIWPGIVQQFQVKPSEPNKEAPYIAKQHQGDPAGLRPRPDVESVNYSDTPDGRRPRPPRCRPAPSTTPVIDPKLVRETFNQNQQARAYYSVAAGARRRPLRLRTATRARPVVLGARELDQDGINPNDRNWNNLHTVYTHGSGLIAAYANQVTAADDATTDASGGAASRTAPATASCGPRATRPARTR